MRRQLLCGLLLLCAISCATSRPHGANNSFNRYPACVERVIGGRVLHDTGWVVSEHDAETGVHFFAFLSTYWGKVVQVTRVNRFCNALRGRFETSAERGQPLAAPPGPTPWR